MIKGSKHSKEAKRKISLSMKGNKTHLGFKHSDETKRKMSEAWKNRTISEETKKKIGDANRGKKHSEESRRKMSESRKGRKSPMLGKKHSKETLLKLSKSHKGLFTREKNPMWKGGRIERVTGYKGILSPTHPNKDHMGYVLEHRLVMEKHIGRYLKPEEVVHHINGIRDDNRIENLILFANDSKHKKHHWELEKQKLCVQPAIS